MLKRGPTTAKTAAALLLTMLASTGCRLLSDDAGVFVDPRDDYVTATVGPPLAVPEGMESSVGDTWPIPEVVDQPTAKTYAGEVPRPRFLASANVDAIKIQKLGTKSWIVLADAPEQVWPLVTQLVADSGVGVEREDPPAGVVETAWFALGAGAGDILREGIRAGLAEEEQTEGGAWLDRVQVRIERAIRPGSSEVHVVHYRTRSESAGDIKTSAVPEVEAELIAKIAAYFAQGPATASVSMVAREIASENKARIVADERGNPMLVLNIGFDRAWATVDGALERSEMNVVATDRDSATFRAVVLAPRRPGFFARVLSRNGGSDGTQVTISLHERAEGIVVEVRDDGGAPVSRDMAEQVLVTLREFAA
ncbi:MAG: outer membrane protein assembly factor BamC [Gammaproteobacteria bacterium]|nr:outer membrane protein assembly factor BamC [Gammaproteobacteria bacterium]MXY58916.1 outer membrane protein assembly factor BamC [Gammaproteobacteria bacterium]MYF27887.1 outer membrane protein assembly factor BamC [Gammaproteobacteria bacterium]MYK47009.1 outer membrane protein assembly factor BamC [Gammaproteobacteria bacterium]